MLYDQEVAVKQAEVKAAQSIVAQCRAQMISEAWNQPKKQKCPQGQVSRQVLIQVNHCWSPT